MQLINAFEEPKKAARDGGYIQPSIAALKEHHEKLKSIWGIETVTEVAIPDVNLKEFIDRLVAHVQ